MLSAVADEHDIAVLTGTFIEDLNATTSVDTPADTGLANTAVLLNRSGEIRLWYRKQHLFGYQSEEADRLVAGETIETAPLRGATVGITTCYDLRFPELYRAFQDAGATLMLVPSAWPSARPMHWRVLTRARAIENQWYLIAVNGAGTIGTTTLLGQSRAYDPWGEAIAALGRDPGMTIATVDPDRVPSVRTDFPILDDRRLR